MSVTVGEEITLRSETVKLGSTRAAHRSLFNALGLGKKELGKPLIGVVNSFNELIPGHMHLREITEAAKTGVWQAGGVPVRGLVQAASDPGDVFGNGRCHQPHLK